MSADSKREDGASAVEYGLLISGIAAIIFAVVLLFGGFIEGMFSDTCTTVNTQQVAQGQTASTCDP
jgi:pilus assembly protein Flp/PilA